MNLYRNAFAIDGAWQTVNSILMAEADDSVAAEIAKLPCGENLARHVSNLKSGRTAPDSIDSELLPYNGMLDAADMEFDRRDFADLQTALENFQPDAAHIEQIRSLPIVQKFGDRWRAGVRAILKNDSLIGIWRTVLQSESAIRLWARASEILSSTPSDLLRAEVQADMPEYETYLPMFGKDGLDALSRLRQFIL